MIAIPRTAAGVRKLLIGMRPGLGEGEEAVAHMVAATGRRWTNWVLPLVVTAVFGLLLLRVRLIDFDVDTQYVIYRVILFDYLIFVLSWACAWNAAWRWRRDQEFTEEVSLTQLRPAAVGQVLVAGHLAIWLRLMVFVALLDIALNCTLLFVGEGTGNLDWSECVLLAMRGAITAVPCLVLAWFHLLTVRLSYWMFVSAAIPRTPLANVALGNFFLIPAFVFILTAFGSMLTGVGMIAAAIALSLLWLGESNPDILVSEWLLLWAMIPGAVITGGLKLWIIRLYEEHFWRRYLCFRWWGAAELTQPKSYPIAFVTAATRWVAFLRLEEASVAKGANAQVDEPSPGREP